MLVSNKRNIFISILIMFFIIINLFNVKSFAMVNPTTDFYVNDYAGLLNTETKNYIINTNKILCNKTGAQIVVVTIPSLENSSLEDYATQLFRNFGIGDKTKNNGVLLLLALEERHFRIEVGYGLEGILPDGKTGRIQDDYIIPYLKQNNWDAGIRNGFSAILQIIADEYNVDVGAENAVSTENTETSDYDLKLPIFGFGGIPVLSFILGVILVIWEKIKNKKIKNVTIIYTIFLVIIYNLIVKKIGILSVDSIGSEQFMNMAFFIIINLICYFSGMSILSETQGYSGSGYSRGYSSRSSGSSGRGGSSGGGGSSRRF